MDNLSLRTMIVRLLKKEFPDVPIYRDKQSKAKLPAFFIRNINVTQAYSGMNIFQQEYLVEIRYRPAESLSNNELSTHLELIGGQIQNTIHIIPALNKEPGTVASEVSCEVSDGVLVVLASYPMRKLVQEDMGAMMATLDERQGIKNV